MLPPSVEFRVPRHGGGGETSHPLLSYFFTGKQDPVIGRVEWFKSRGKISGQTRQFLSCGKTHVIGAEIEMKTAQSIDPFAHGFNGRRILGGHLGKNHCDIQIAMAWNKGGTPRPSMPAVHGLNTRHFQEKPA
jgi:hypothetical protein